MIDILILLGLAFAGGGAGLFGYIRTKKKESINNAYGWTPERVQADAGFASDQELRKAGYFKSAGFRLGRTLSGKSLFYNGLGHITVIAAARTGKLFTFLGTLIMKLPRRFGLLLVDPKAEMICIVGAIRRRCGTVYVWNPYQIWVDHMSGLRQVCINPMADIDPNSITFVSDCRKLVTTFWDPTKVANDPHWGPSGHGIFKGIIQVLVKYGKPWEKTLPMARTILTGANGRSVFEFAQYVMTLPDIELRRVFARFAAPDAKDSKELISIVSTAMTQTEFLDNPPIAKGFSRADVSVKIIKQTLGSTLCVCLPVNRLDDSKCSALISGWTLHWALELGSRGSKVPCVAVIDEMSQIGWSKAWQDAFGLAAGAAGMQIVSVYQDVSQIVAQFKDAWQTILQNSGVVAIFGARDQATMDAASKMSGLTQIVTRNRSVSIDHKTGWPHVSDSISGTVRPVLHPHEVRGLRKDEMLLFCEGVANVVKARRRPYTRECSGYGPNPYFKKRGLF